MEITVGATTISSEQADLLTLDVDVIVNAANERLAHGGGLAAAIVQAGGNIIQSESDDWIMENGPLTPDIAAVTGSGSLPYKAIVHTAGPIYREGRDNEGLLRRAVAAALARSAGTGYRSVALPAISAGAFGYPLEEACAVIASECAAWAEEHPNALHRIRLIGRDEATAEAFASGLQAIG